MVRHNVLRFFGVSRESLYDVELKKGVHRLRTLTSKKL
jgi:hypothetical protein